MTTAASALTCVCGQKISFRVSGETDYWQLTVWHGDDNYAEFTGDSDDISTSSTFLAGFITRHLGIHQSGNWVIPEACQNYWGRISRCLQQIHDKPDADPF